MTTKSICLTVICLCATSIVAAELAQKWQKRITDIEANYAAAVTKADNARFFAIQRANAERVSFLKKALSDATKSGDFAGATILQSKVKTAELDGTPKSKPKNVVKFDSHEYALIEQDTSWYAAKLECEQMGGHLIVLDSPGEVEILDRLCNAKLIVWLGASDHVKEDDYVWITGGKVDTSGANLDRDANGCADVLCYDSGTHKIIDYHSGGRGKYVCEWDR